MYQEFFGFSEMPFNITPDPKFLYLSPTHQEAIQHLRYGISQKKGFIVLVGEVGCGKTTLCRYFLNDLENDTNCDTALILNPRITETQLLKAILKELGAPSNSRSRSDLVAQVEQILLEKIEQGRDIVLIIDESQNLSFELLEQLRLLSNLETDKQKLLQIVLIGQPELKKLLGRKDLRQLRQRILVYYELKPLNFSQTEQYIHHRLSLAGSRGVPQFSRWALRMIHRASKGIPRIVNTLCDKVLLSAFIRESESVDFWDVRRVLKEHRSITRY
ncbi:MAG: ATPase [Puniceicoccaceae bacterium]|nr:MAG: ATPase [Puniceicoccaceae bacterium]